MRRMMSLLAVLLVCLTLVTPAAAAIGDFVPSITYKDTPDIDKVEGAEKSCIVVTSIKQAEDKTTDITQDDRDLLLDVYKKLSKGEMKLPLDYDYVVKYLVDVSWKYNACRVPHEHKQWHDKDDTVVTLTFDVGVAKGADMDVLAYVDGKWVEVPAKNNGNGTVTCEFEDFCPVAFCVKASTNAAPPKTGDAAGANLWIWIVLMAVALVLIVALVVIRRKRK